VGASEGLGRSGFFGEPLRGVGSPFETLGGGLVLARLSFFPAAHPLRGRFAGALRRAWADRVSAGDPLRGVGSPFETLGGGLVLARLISFPLRIPSGDASLSCLGGSWVARRGCGGRFGGRLADRVSAGDPPSGCRVPLRNPGRGPCARAPDFFPAAHPLRGRFALLLRGSWVARRGGGGLFGGRLANRVSAGAAAL
jgi:hypothetical protein